MHFHWVNEQDVFHMMSVLLNGSLTVLKLLLWCGDSEAYNSHWSDLDGETMSRIKQSCPVRPVWWGSWTGFAQGRGKVTVTHTSVRNSVRRMLGVGHICVLILWKISSLFLLCLLLRLIEGWPFVVLSVKTIRACHGTSDVKPYSLKGVIHKPLLQ